MLIKGDPGGAKSLPEQNVDSSSLESIPENFTKNVQAMLTKALIWNSHFGFFYEPAMRQWVNRLITVSAFRSAGTLKIGYCSWSTLYFFTVNETYVSWIELKCSYSFICYQPEIFFCHIINVIFICIPWRILLINYLMCGDWHHDCKPYKLNTTDLNDTETATMQQLRADNLNSWIDGNSS